VACVEEEGSPFHHVNTFQPPAANSPSNTTTRPASPCGTDGSKLCTSATERPVVTRPPRVVKAATTTNAMRGVSARVRTAAATELEAS
jgi:hypothetical protein